MEEHQNNTDVQDTQAGSGNGASKVMRAGSEAKSGRRVLRSGGASNDGNQPDVADHATDEAARSIVQAGQQALEGAKAATHATDEAAQSVVRAGQQTLGRTGAAVYATTNEAAQSVVRAGQQALEGAEAATHAAAEASDSKGAGQALEELANCVGRAYHRNIQAVSDLMHCYTFQSLLQWQSNLLNATITDWTDTNARILQLVTHKAKLDY
jgi:hypothetical protein